MKLYQKRLYQFSLDSESASLSTFYLDLAVIRIVIHIFPHTLFPVALALH